MSKAAELAALIGSQTALSNRNMIINGAMKVAQRGTSSTAASYGSVDRFFYSASNLDNHAFTQTQQAVTDLAEFTNSFRITTTTAESAIAANELVYVAQKIEAQNCQQLAYGTSSAKQVTLSFYVKSSVTGTFSTNLYEVDDSRIVNSEYTISSANTWERKEITYVADQTGVIDNNNGTGFYVTWNLALGSSFKGNAATAWEAYNTDNWAGAGTYTDAVITTVNSTWEITGIQLEIGEVATPFEHEDFGTTLAKCQRYYFRQNHDTNIPYLGAGAVYRNTLAMLIMNLPVAMRAAPAAIDQSGTAAHYTAWGNESTTACSAVPTIRAGDSKTSVNVDLTFNTLNSATGTYVYRIVNTSGYLGVSAEL